MAANTNQITVTLRQVAKMIDHSLLHPTMTDADILNGLAISKKYSVATACVKPYLIPLAKQELAGSDVLVCPVIGFPHGNSTTAVKVFEADAAAAAGGKEIDMVINIGKAMSGDWDYVADEIRQINDAVLKQGAILKVIFENDYLTDDHIVQLCKICSDIGVGFVKTSTGYGFVKQPNGLYSYKGATVPHLKLMRAESKPEVQVKAAGGVRTLDDLLHVMSLGVTRIGATATVAIMEEAAKRGITDQPTTVQFKPIEEDVAVPKRRRLPTPRNQSSTSTPLSSSRPVGRSSFEFPDPSLNRGHNDSTGHTHWNASSIISLIEEVRLSSSVVHWFTFLFHQQTFRHKFQSLYNSGPEQHYATNSHCGYIAVFLAVIATSLHYTNVEQKQKLRSNGIDTELLKDKILLALKLRFLDIISAGSLEVVQMCILLGSYYIYHGQPELAWPLCGSGLRIAQALNLHRETPHKEDDASFRQIIGDRKRAWWAIYEIETFCSMLYGFPTNIFDGDCDVAFLDPYDECSGSVSKGQHVSKPNLLFFKCAMSELSAIIKGTVDNLYRPRSGQVQKNTDYGSRLRNLVDEVESLNQKLVNCNERLDTKLRFDDPAVGSAVGNHSIHSLGTSETAFEERLFRLQALSLKLAYENARILIHRPLLSFKLLQRSTADGNDPQSRTDPFQEAMRICRDAALKISKADLKIFQEASETYAVSFIALHLLTAAYESRMGIRRLMQIQSLLREKSIIAAQGLEITKRLMSLNKFLAEAMLEYEQAVRIPTNAYSSNISASTSNQNDPFLGISFPSQEQGWIWGWNFPESK
ncbi:hypothetical protein EDB82DRAFT_544297 [Fusarium venenatum]|uniref:uncharacterized protein n=1 Tax=Fusarium venenatum TaxID=56646 RepID=UPI001DD11DDB|nr:hypothetical protein EDB82DRAFT_544297 [Fusarium venenatum]